MKPWDRQSESKAPVVPGKAKQGADIRQKWDWVEASIWTERMLAALENGVKGGKWFDYKQWPNAFFAEQGLFTMTEARALASQPRC